MLSLLFRLGSERYAIPCKRVERIVPMVRLKQMPQAPPYLAGLLNYRQRIVPVLDLCVLSSQKPAANRLSSRIILAKYPATQDSERLLGLLAEEVTETDIFDEARLVEPGVSVEGAPYLGRVVSGSEGMIQLIEIDQLIPAAVREALFQPSAA